MRLLRYVDIIDLGIAALVIVYLLIGGSREIFASSAYTGSETEQFALALAEARTMAHPEDGAAIDELSRRLGDEGAKDWAIEVAVRGSERAGQSPTRWRALLAAAVAYVGRFDVVPGLDYANRALAACDAHRSACPSWEQIRMALYQQQLDAGVRSGIDPHRGPESVKAFRHAEEGAVRQIHLGGHDVERGTGTAAPTPSSSGGSGSNYR